jgi:hypothetical protein
VVEIKDKDRTLIQNLIHENTDRRQIIDADPTAIVVTATIQPEEPTDPEEGEPFSFTDVGEGDPCCILLLIAEARRTSSQQRSSNSWDC